MIGTDETELSWVVDFSTSIIDSTSFWWWILKSFSWASAWVLWSSFLLFNLARFALAAALLAAACLVSWIAWAARNSCSFCSASNFWAASSAWSLLSSVYLCFWVPSSSSLSFSACSIFFSSWMFFLSSSCLTFSSVSNLLRRSFCWESCFFLSSWTA